MSLNPDDPDLHAIAASQLYNCGDPDAEAAARRAIALDPNPPANFYTALVFLSLDRGDVAGARALTHQMVPGPNAAPGFYDMIFAVVAAASGDRQGATEAWNRLARIEPGVQRNPSGVFRRWALPARVEQKALAYLRDAGVIPGGAPTAVPAAQGSG
jgi:hypothetical protein